MAELGPAGQAPVAVAVVVADGRVLLVHGAGDEAGPSWQFPGGEIEPGESDEEAAERETLEEAGVTVNAVGRLGNRVHPVTGRTVVYVACRPAEGPESGPDDGDATPPTASAEVKWCDRAMLAERLPEPFEPVAAYLDEHMA